MYKALEEPSLSDLPSHTAFLIEPDNHDQNRDMFQLKSKINSVVTCLVNLSAYKLEICDLNTNGPFSIDASLFAERTSRARDIP